MSEPSRDHKPAEATPDLHERVRQLEAECARLREEADFYRAEAEYQSQEIRYRLGDLLVRSFNHPADFVKLPFRLAALWRERRKRKERTASVSTKVATADHFESVKASPRPPRSPLKAAVIMDDFTAECFRYELQLIPVTPGDYRKVIEAERPDFLFVESAWRGNGGVWQHAIDQCERLKGKPLLPLLDFCRRQNLPTVFWNKEDPPNFDHFIFAARQFDHIFTTDADCIPRYREQVSHPRIYPLPFAAQPMVHHPMLSQQRDRAVCFAGTWYNRRHLDRRLDALNLLRPALDFDLHIYDRMADGDDPSYAWPQEFVSAIRGGLPYEQMLAAYKAYKIFLNVNSVKHSPTMFSRRVFELLACGTPVISTPSVGIEKLLGADLVPLTDSEEHTRELLDKLLSEDDCRDHLALRGQRKVFGEHTYAHRLNFMLEKVGLPVPSLPDPPMTMIAVVETADQLKAVWDHYHRQSYRNKKMVVCSAAGKVLRGLDGLIANEQSVYVVHEPSAAAGVLVRKALEYVGDGWVAAVNPGDYYARHYLTDCAHVALYQNGPFGKSVYYQYDPARGVARRACAGGAEYMIGQQVRPWTLCLPAEKALSVAGGIDAHTTAEAAWRQLVERQAPCYATSRFNYVACPSSEAADPSQFEQAIV